jgi:hypothetical protein
MRPRRAQKSVPPRTEKAAEVGTRRLFVRVVSVLDAERVEGGLVDRGGGVEAVVGLVAGEGFAR